MIGVLVACWIAHPQVCQTHSFTLKEITPVMQFLEAQSLAIDWLAEHPGLQQIDLRVERGLPA